MTKVKKKGYDFNVGPECEFFLFKLNEGKPTTIPNDKGGYFDLSPLDLAENIRGDISATLQELGFNAYTSHHEVAPSQHEINFHHADALSLIYVTKAIALRYGLHATFMPKPIYGINGSGMHTHQSLVGKEGNAFYDPDGKYELSDSAIYYIGGLLKYAREICAVVNSWVNSYKRLVPGYEAPTYISWANRNRSALVRIPSKRGEGTRCELRNPDAAGNPYLQFAVMLAAGFKGIEKKIEPPEPVEKDIYVLTQREREELGIEALPANLGHALSYMEKSELVLETLDTHIFTHFLHVKRNEWSDYRTQVTQWEIEKYLPIL
jgi:glutamine synthetase